MPGRCLCQPAIEIGGRLRIDQRCRTRKVNRQQHFLQYFGAVDVVTYLNQFAGLNVEPSDDALGESFPIGHRWLCTINCNADSTVCSVKGKWMPTVANSSASERVLPIANAVL